ncbi:MAG: glycosyltransferase [Deltaproteobacteria bacterium]|nr:glycosyltransferase [Deltaproteobacteria bacterium]
MFDNKKVTNLITVGFTEKKGLEYGIRAVAKLVSSGHNLHYNIVGDGQLKGKIQSLINDHNMENVVTLCGFRDQTELIDLVADADFMIAPSITTATGDQEGIPNVLKEAMATGLPVISTRHAGIPELVHEGISGFLVPERDIDALAEKMNFLIRHPEKAVEMGKAGIAFVRQEYDIDKLNDRLVMRYESLLSGAKILVKVNYLPAKGR